MPRFGLLLQMALLLFCLKYHYQISTQPLSNREVHDMQQPSHLGDVQMISFNQFCNAPNARQQCKVHIHRNNLLQSHLFGGGKNVDIEWDGSCIAQMLQKLELPHAQALAKRKLDAADASMFFSARINCNSPMEERLWIIASYMLNNYSRILSMTITKVARVSVSPSHMPRSATAEMLKCTTLWGLGIDFTQSPLQIVHHVIELVHFLGQLSHVSSSLELTKHYQNPFSFVSPHCVFSQRASMYEYRVTKSWTPLIGATVLLVALLYYRLIRH